MVSKAFPIHRSLFTNDPQLNRQVTVSMFQLVTFLRDFFAYYYYWGEAVFFKNGTMLNFTLSNIIYTVSGFLSGFSARGGISVFLK